VAGFGNAEKLREVFETDDPAKIAEAVSNLWEKPGVPHMERRKEAAAKYMEAEPEDTTVVNYPQADQAQFSDLMSRLLQQGK
jgi:hypothetical protein